MLYEPNSETDQNTMEEAIKKLEEEKRVMLECARLNPRETGNSIYMQLAIMAQRKIDAIRLTQQFQP